MRLLTISMLLCMFSAAAAAHTLPADTGVAAQLGHQLLGTHHLPMLGALLLAAGALNAGALRRWLRGRAAAPRRRPR
ncbi:MAG TPA: hypothetical protein VFE85_06025 [Woeseiaceae bacterium]|nr:hypothetical protein [Woeseiaceae bacterium]